MKRKLAKHWSLTGAIFILWATITGILILTVAQNNGHLVYAQDDPYIHMAMAKNFVQHGVFGVTRYEFSSSSSSILWTLTLSLVYLIFGVNEIAPLILNIMFATAVIVAAYKIVHTKISQIYIFLVLFGLIFFSPLPVLIFIGMEHVMHMFLAILLAYLSAWVLSEDDVKLGKTRVLYLLGITPFLSLVRYEALFLVFVVCLLFVLRKQILYAFWVGGLAIIPIGIYGLISIVNGWFWLPNSVLLKGGLPDDPTSIQQIVSYLRRGYDQFFQTPEIAILIIITLVLYILQSDKQRKIWDSNKIVIKIFVGTALLHLQFGSISYIYRYEAYLVALGVLITGVQFSEYLIRQQYKIKIDRTLVPKYIATSLLVLLLTLPFIYRAIASTKIIPQAITNIYEQQYQMGLFLRQFYQGTAIAANDIGAINYLADIQTLDLAGLGSVETAIRLRQPGGMSREEIQTLSKLSNIKIAVVYDHWFETGRISTGGIPQVWKKVGSWKIENQVAVGGSNVSFYAVSLSERDALAKNLQQFGVVLPPGVKQQGEFVDVK